MAAQHKHMKRLGDWRRYFSEGLLGVRRPYVFVVLLLVAGVIGREVVGQEAGDTAAEHYVQRVEAFAVSAEDFYQETRLFSGRVKARQHADMGFEQGGKLADVLVDEGDIVRAGEVLAILDVELLRIEERELAAQLAETQARLTLTESSLKRQQSLKLNGFTSEQRLDELHSERDSLIAAIARLDAAVASVASRVRKSTLSAPFDGVVTRRFADQGVAINPAQAVVRLQQQGSMEVHVGVPVEAALRLQPGQALPIEIHDQLYSAQVLAVGADVHPLTRTLLVRFGLPVDTPTVNGDLATLVLESREDVAGFWVPATAIGGGVRGVWNVYVMVDESHDRYRLQARTIKVKYVHSQRAFISGDLKDGERIVATGLQRVVVGQLVRTELSAEVAGRLAPVGAVQ